MERRFPNGSRLRLETGDITRVEVDAIANAANSRLAGGGGVDGAIHRAGGPAIMRELDAIRAERGGCPTGGAVATTAGQLRAKYVFHAVGPVWHGGGRQERERLESCYRTCLELAEAREARTIAFPSIGTGVYGYPVEEAAEAALGVVAAHLRRPETHIEEVVFVLFDQATFDAYAAALAALE